MLPGFSHSNIPALNVEQFLSSEFLFSFALFLSDFIKLSRMIFSVLLVQREMSIVCIVRSSLTRGESCGLDGFPGGLSVDSGTLLRAGTM